MFFHGCFAISTLLSEVNFFLYISKSNSRSLVVSSIENPFYRSGVSKLFFCKGSDSEYFRFFKPYSLWLKKAFSIEKGVGCTLLTIVIDYILGYFHIDILSY